ncbi:hypothetical protein BGX27_002340 [Mortierella sp. AM989]|nr:hypothetical protein BGX27_002340 [Mortierella sp. AM989]
MAPLNGGGSNLEDTPPGSPTTPIAPFLAQYGQQQQQIQLQLQRGPASSRAFGQTSPGMEPTQLTLSSPVAAPGADTSITSIGSNQSFSSLNSGSHGHSSSINDGPGSIISNSILTTAVNQSMASSGGGLNSNNSFFSFKQSNITRGITNNLSPISPTGSPTPQHDQALGSNTPSPTTSVAITRPPMSSQRNRDNIANRNANQSNPSHANTSFSSVNSADGSSATIVNPGFIIPSAVPEVVAQVSSPSVQVAKSTMSVTTATVDATQSTTVVSGAETTPSSTLRAPSSAFTTSTSRHPQAAAAATPASASSSHRSHRQQQDLSESHSRNHSSHSSTTQNQGHGHGQSTSTPKKHRHKVPAAANRDTARPSATVPVAPTPAMHWTRAKVHGQSPPKELRAQTVNLVGESIYVFGGCDAKTCFNTLYIFDADTMHWSQPKTFGSIPPPCRAHSSTLVDNKRLFIFGGGDGPHYFNELYMLDTDTLTWTNPQTTGSRPCRRRAHTTCFYNNCIYVFGGGDGVQALNDTYRLDLTTMRWSELKTTGTPPMSRGYHTSNLIKSHFIVYGGSDGHECFSDVHVLDLDTKVWTKIDINRALPRLSHTSTQVGSYLFVVGGHDGSRYSSDVLMLNLVTWSWETRRVYGIPPAGRGYHALLLYDSRLFMFGGYDGQTVFDDIYILDLSTCAYLPQITDFQISLQTENEEAMSAGY